MTSSDYELRDRIELVSNAAGSTNDLLTVAIPPEQPVGELLERVEEDHAEAEYLDADEASRARRDVLEAARHRLHQYDGTPENGLVLYVGALEEGEEVVEYVFDRLPDPVAESRYEWDNEFDVAPLETAAEASATYGLLVVERGGAALGRLEGDRVEVVETIESDVMGKTRAGGQSAQRFERDRERQKHEFFEEVADEAERAFLEDGSPAVDGLLVGGTTITVDEFTDGDYLDHRLQDATVGGQFSVEYASEQGLHQLVEKGRDAMADAEREPVRRALERFREGLHEGAGNGAGVGDGAGAGDGDEDGDPVAYGEDAVETALEYGAVETTLVSGSLPTAEIREYEERTQEEGGDLIVVPPDTEEGARFDRTFGVAAILRYPID